MPRYSLNAFGRKIPIADTSEPLSKQVGRRLQGQPDTKIDSGGSVNSFTFDGQDHLRTGGVASVASPE